jgi:hypothetical protein
MFYTVFSTNLSPKMQWQSDLLEFSWKRVGQEGELVRLCATDDPDSLPVQKHAYCVATTLWDIHPETDDAWPIYNKPASLLEWVYRNKPEGTVLLLDPDCVFRAPVTRRVAPGFPASQEWIDFKIGKPGPENPFGLGERFSFLNDYCTRTDQSIAPVMIPTLIHTRDLRRIGARWLELCRVIRDNYRDADGRPASESDMFAYLAACTEYGLQHEPIPLGICTNWEPADVPDAPIVHYCQQIFGTDGKTIFNKHTYKPWSRLDTAVELERDRTVVTLINEHVDSLQGLGGAPAPANSRPHYRDGIMEGRVLDDFLLERPKDGASLWLNSSGKAVWELCDGSRTIEEIAAKLGARFAVDQLVILPEVRSIVGKLHAIEFLDLRSSAAHGD